jgi:5'-3' exonuclease
MGIPSYFSYIIKNYSNIIRNLTYHLNKKTTFHSLYMDCNSIIYDSYNSIKNDYNKNNITVYEFEDILIKNIISKIDFYIKTIHPKNVLYIAFDGVAPFAKMDQQRSRRYKVINMPTINSTSDEPPVPVFWNTSSITPGTNFMDRLSKSIRFVYESNELKYGINNIICSCSDEPGEGEHKMFEHVRSNIQSNDNIVVYGLDSDLIMLSIFHNNLCNNIYVAREAPEFMNSKINQKWDLNDMLFMDIEELSRSIISEMECSNNDKHRTYDYIFLCFLLGNDFLPHFPSLNIRTSGIQIIMETYRKHMGSYSDRFLISKTTGNIDWKWVYLILNELSKMEHESFIKEYTARDKLESIPLGCTTEKEKENVLNNAPIIYRISEKYICPQEKFWENRYYNTLLKKERNNENVKDICINYLEGLEWVFKYYTKGCQNWRWKYNYHYPPLLVDLVKYIPSYETHFIVYNGVPFHPNTQLAYVIPPENHHLLGNKNKDILMKYYSHLFSGKIEFEWAYCRYLWESHIILPEIPLDILEKWEKILQ